MTSDTRKHNTRAGDAARASCPPPNADRCLRKALISPMLAPQASRLSVSVRISFSVTPATGAGVSALAPPVNRQITRSSAPACRASANSSAVAACPAASGTGCDASNSRIRSSAMP